MRVAGPGPNPGVPWERERPRRRTRPRRGWPGPPSHSSHSKSDAEQGTHKDHRGTSGPKTVRRRDPGQRVGGTPDFGRRLCGSVPPQPRPHVLPGDTSRHRGCGKRNRSGCDRKAHGAPQSWNPKRGPDTPLLTEKRGKKGPPRVRPYPRLRARRRTKGRTRNEGRLRRLRGQTVEVPGPVPEPDRRVRGGDTPVGSGGGVDESDNGGRGRSTSGGRPRAGPGVRVREYH